MKKQENRRAIGNFYEKVAGAYLESQGYQILQYNYRCRFAEIDIVARDGEYLVFCEVKYRRKRGGQPLESVDKKKQRRISMGALFYLAEHKINAEPCRFDVVGIRGEEIQLVKNAFNYMGR